MRKKGKKLDFISRVNRDGSGVEPIDPRLLNSELQYSDKFKLMRLSMSEDTYLAFNMNVYVVKLKLKKLKLKKQTK